MDATEVNMNASGVRDGLYWDMLVSNRRNLAFDIFNNSAKKVMFWVKSFLCVCSYPKK